MKQKQILFISAFLLLSACAAPPEPTVTPTELPRTATLEPSATSTEAPSPTPTLEPVREFPLSYLQPFFDFLTKYGLRVKDEGWKDGDQKYDFSYVVAACLGQEFSEFGNCVVEIDLCPTSQQCSDRVLAIQYMTTADIVWPVTDYMNFEDAVFHFLLFDKYYFVVKVGKPVSKDFLMSENQAKVWACMVGRPETARWLPLAAWEMSEKIAETLFLKGKLFYLTPANSKGLVTCTQTIFGN